MILKSLSRKIWLMDLMRKQSSCNAQKTSSMFTCDNIKTCSLVLFLLCFQVKKMTSKFNTYKYIKMHVHTHF